MQFSKNVTYLIILTKTEADSSSVAEFTRGLTINTESLVGGGDGTGPVRVNSFDWKTDILNLR